ncbi:MAG: hypothetical protein KF760_11285 [Candidatus Eremiobacteraeota bacterium]|nr:hypothetical protein [Candidatus Eremiobacteraeota bacterium]MCW5868254.1 hypothetical protein [Candidatus Eremiobacteraeota bacterium]
MDALNLLGNSKDLIRGFAALLAAIEQANLMTGGQGSPASATASVNPFANIQDSFSRYDEQELPNGNKLRRYDTGNVRILNPRSGIVQEERPNGNFLVSLPTGRIIFQEQPGYPLLVFSSIHGGPPLMARVCVVQLGAASEARPAFQFEDQEGNHFVDLDSLRYVKVAPAHVQATQVDQPVAQLQLA